MRGGHYVPCVAIRATIVADAAISVEGVSGGDRGRYLAVQEKAGAGDDGAVDEIAARDRLVHSEAIHSSGTRLDHSLISCMNTLSAIVIGLGMLTASGQGSAQL